MGNITRHKTWLVSLMVFLSTFGIYYLSSAGHTPYNHFTLLANSFLKGKLYIEADAPWLEKIPITDQKFYVANPPMPAIISIPFVLVFGKDFPQEIIAHSVGGLATVSVMLLSLHISKSWKTSIWMAILSGFGTIMWFLASVGSTWYLAHVVSALFLTLAIVFMLKKNTLLSGAFLGASYLTRIPTILSLPFFLVYLLKTKSGKKFLLFFLGMTPFILFNFWYNYSRFGVIWDKGYTLIPGVASEPWYDKGLIHYSYIPEHLKIIFTSLPVFRDRFPYIFPTWQGLAVWFTTPAFVYTLWNSPKKHSILAAWSGILPVALLVFSHGSTGFAQFGYRFAVDFYPFLFFLLIKNAGKNPKWHHWLFLTLSVLVNLWGVVWINKSNWVIV